MSNNTKKIAIIGFGYIGSVIGAVLADKGNKVIGIEKNPRILEAVKQARTPFAEPGLQEYITRTVQEKKTLEITDDFSRISDCEAIIITVGTPLSDHGEPDLTQIQSVVENITPYIKEGQIFCLKSTVPPFTTEKIVSEKLCKHAKVHVAFSPERLAEGKAISELLSFPIIIGGVDPESTRKAANFWKETLGNKVIEVESARAAELVKLADNLWIDLNISLGQELAKLCDKMSIDVLEVISAANTLPKGNYNVNILMPSVGVGGYCLTKDPWFVHNLGTKYGLDLLTPQTSRKINDEMPIYSANRIIEFLQKTGKKPEQCKVAILGIAFKNNTGDCRFSPTKPVIDELEKQNYQLEIFDPWVEEHDSKLITNKKLATNIEQVLKSADCVAFLAGHDDFKKLTPTTIASLANKNAMIFDGRMFYSRETIEEFKKLGLTYKGVGR